MNRIFATLLFTLLGIISLCAQSWNLVWQEDFGVVPDSVYADFADPSKAMPGHRFAKQGTAIQDGWYAIVSHVYNDPMGSWWYPMNSDHTGNKDGGMLLCNTDGTLEGEIIYSQKIEFPICSTNKYKFVMYAGGSTNFGGILPSFEMVVNASDGTVLGRTETNGVPMLYDSYDWSGDPTWSKYEVEFDPDNYEWVEFQLINRAECTEDGSEPDTQWNDECQCHKIQCGSGNDFVLDDIQLFRQDSETVPDPDITNKSLIEETALHDCMYSSSFQVPNKVLDDWHQLYKHIYFLWQESEDGYTWNDLAEPISGINHTKTEFEADATKQMQYRVIITGADESETMAKEIAGQISKNGGPDDGCYLFSISNTLSATLPKPDCKYRSNLRVLWNEDFGVCDTTETKSHPNAGGLFYEDDGVSKFETGNYVVTSHPDKAIHVSVPYYFMPYPEVNSTTTDSKGKQGGAFLYGKSSITDTIIYQKEYNGPFCNCKAYMLNVDVYKKTDWSTLPVRIEVLDGTDVIGEAYTIIKGGTGGWNTISAPFQLPSDFNKAITLRVSYMKTYLDDNKNLKNSEENLSYAIDNVSVAVCGETMPSTSVYIDGDKTLTLLSGFDCNDETPHTVDFDGKAEWLDQYPNAAFIWQTSVDNGTSWTNLSETSTSINYESIGYPEILYRVVVGESQSVANEVAANGKPADGCSIYYITNVAGFMCKESGCRKPVFQFEGDTFSAVCSDATEAVEIVAVQQNSANVDAMQWYSKLYNETTWTEITGAIEETLEITTLPADSTDYLFLAINDTCPSDSIFYRLNVHTAITLEPWEDTVLCMGDDLKIKAVPLTGVPSKYVWSTNPALTTDELNLTSIATDQSVSVYATDGVCKSLPLEMDIKAETPITFTEVDEINLCEGESFTIDPQANGDILEIIWSLTGADGLTKVLDEAANEKLFSDIASASATYTFELNGNKCPSVSFQVPVNVSPLPSFTDFSISAKEICAGDELTISADLRTAATVQYFAASAEDLTGTQFETTAEVIGDLITIKPTETKRYWAIIPSGGYCPAVSSDTLLVNVEQKLDFTFEEIPSTVCAGTPVNLSATLVSGTPVETTWSKGTDNLSNELSTADTPTASAYYTFTAQGTYCKNFTKPFNVEVEKSENLAITSSDEEICAGTTLTLTATYGEATNLTWESSVDGSHYSSISEELTTTLEQTPTVTTFYRLKTVGAGICPQAFSDPISVKVEERIDFSLSEVATICSGTVVDLAASITAGEPTAYVWSKDGVSFSTDLNTSDTPEQTTLYELTVSGNKCAPLSKTVSVEVEKIDDLTLVATDSKICKGSNVTLNATYGEATSLSWEVSTDGTNFTEMGNALTESLDVTPEVTSTYRLKTAGKVCNANYSDPATIEVEQPIEFTLAQTPTIICAGNIVELSATLTSGEATQYSWTKDNAPLADVINTSDSPTSDVLYALTIKGDKCEGVTHDVSIAVEQPVHLTLSSSADSICLGETLTLTAGYESSKTLVWEKSTDGINYTSFSQTVTEVQTDQPAVSTYYRLKTNGEGACDQSFSDIVEVTVEQPIQFALSTIPSVICEGTTVSLGATLTAGDASAITWTIDGAPLANTLQATDQPDKESVTYELTIKGHVCPAVSHDATVTVEKMPSVSLSLLKNEVCKGTDVTLSLSHDNCKGLSWKRKYASEETFNEFSQELTERLDITATETASYQVSTTGNQVCPSQTTETATLTVEQPVSVQLSGDQMICPGESRSITAIIGGTPTSTIWYSKTAQDADYVPTSLTGTTISVQPTTTTQYKLVANANQCPPDDEEATVTVDEIPTLDINISSDHICEGEGVDLSTSFAYTPNIIWTAESEGKSEVIATGESELTLYPTATTIYTLKATSQANCPAGEFKETVIVDKAISATVDNQAICQGDSVSMKCLGSPTYQYTWTVGNETVSNMASFVAKPNETTTYNIKVVNGVCEESLTSTLTVSAVPQIISCEEVGNKTYQLIAESPNLPLTYDFGNGKGTTLSDVMDNVIYGRSYHITVTDNIGCISDTTIETPSYDVIIPEYFNADTEGWKVTNIEKYNNATISIFDRFGKKLVDIKGETAEGWDGTYKGQKMPSTDYWYVIAIGEIDKVYTGHFTLIR